MCSLATDMESQGVMVLLPLPLARHPPDPGILSSQPQKVIRPEFLFKFQEIFTHIVHLKFFQQIHFLRMELGEEPDGAFLKLGNWDGADNVVSVVDLAIFQLNSSHAFSIFIIRIVNEGNGGIINDLIQNISKFVLEDIEMRLLIQNESFREMGLVGLVESCSLGPHLVEACPMFGGDMRLQEKVHFFSGILGFDEILYSKISGRLETLRGKVLEYDEIRLVFLFKITLIYQFM